VHVSCIHCSTPHAETSPLPCSKTCLTDQRKARLHSSPTCAANLCTHKQHTAAPNRPSFLTTRFNCSTKNHKLGVCHTQCARQGQVTRTTHHALSLAGWPKDALALGQPLGIEQVVGSAQSSRRRAPTAAPAGWRRHSPSLYNHWALAHVLRTATQCTQTSTAISHSIPGVR